MSAMHQHLRDWREANLADWRATDLADRPARTTVYAAVLHESDGIAPARFGTVSKAEAQRLRARDAIAVERYVAPESRALTRLNYLAAGVLLAASVVLYFAPTGPTELEAQHDVAADVQEAVAMAGAAR